MQRAGLRACNAPATVSSPCIKGGYMNRLQEAVIEQLGYEEEDFEDKDGELFQTLSDVANYGASGGFSGFTYYEDTIQFVKDNRRQIKELVTQMSEDFGVTPLDFIMSFNCLKDSITDGSVINAVGAFVYGAQCRDDQEHDGTTVYNALAWFALEEVARQCTGVI